MDDPRFHHVSNDPRFKSVPRRTRKVKIDSRFQSMFSDDKFKVKYHVDKRGKRVAHTSNEDLRKYYQLEGEDEGCSEPRHLEDEGRFEGESTSSSDESISESENEEELFNEEVVHPWGNEERAEEDGEVSSRLAICNIDWDRISAEDLYVLISSFKPRGGLVQSVTVYPSDFGLERMAKEDIEGPSEGLAGDGEGKSYSQEKLRQYQLSRLNYFYAVVECDSAATAEHIYEQCDGLEYEHSGGRLDLRFIPEGMSFEDREPKSEARDAPAGYKPSDFFTTALQQSKVNLTWDETDPRRLQSTMRKFTKDDVLSMDFSAYLASSSDEDGDGLEREGGEEDQIQKYRDLLDGEEEVEKEGEEIEITWEPGLREKAEDLVRKKAQGQMTPWESYLTKVKERKKERKKGVKSADQVHGDKDMGFDDPFFQHDVTTATVGSKKRGRRRDEAEGSEDEREQLELLVMDEEGEKEHFSLKKIMEDEHKSKLTGKKKRKSRNDQQAGTVDTFEVDVHDPRFSALYESHLYAPDPSHPHYRPTKAMTALMKEKQRRRHKDGKAQSSKGGWITDPSIAALVESVKYKSNSLAQRRKIGEKRAHKIANLSS